MKSLKIFGISLVFGLQLVLASAAHAEECPNTIYYSNGNYLKYGSTFYYPNGNYLKYGSTVYYPNGNYLKYGSTIYYESGNYLKYGSTIYYPNNNYLKYGSTYYYNNGNYFKYGSTFYHKNGNYARYGTTLYREDGSQTAFPVRLDETVGNHGYLSALVKSNGEELNLVMDDLIIDQSGVSMESYWEGGDFHHFMFDINSGVNGEDVLLKIDDNGFDCRLGSNPPPPDDRHFTIRSRAADVEVYVKPGYDPRDVRRALEDALDRLR